jgi:hypothetical protein
MIAGAGRGWSATLPRVAGPSTLSGEIHFPADAPSLMAADVRVLVEDVSRVDAAAPVVAETLLSGVDTGPGAALEFSLTVDVNDATHYNLRVHVDTDASGDVSVGDLITTQSYPVLTFEAPSRATVSLQRVT